MAKKLFYIFLLLIPFLGKAQIQVGDWKVHSMYDSSLTNIIDLQDKVYYLTAGCLYCYDKESQANEAYNNRNKLSDIKIQNIYYNYIDKFLLIVYENSNIDFLYNDGKIVNVPDLKDVILSSSKTINGVNFDNGKTYLATDFGYLVLNNKKHEVIESHQYGKAIYDIAVIGNKLMLTDKTVVYISDLNGKHTAIDNFFVNNTKNIVRFIPISDSDFIYYTGWTFKGHINDDNSISTSDLNQGETNVIQQSDTAFILKTKTQIKMLSKKGVLVKTITLPETYANSLVSSYNAGKSFWVGDKKGIKNVKFDENGTETIISDYFKPSASTVVRPYTMAFNSALNKLYVTDKGSNEYISQYWLQAPINTLTGSTWEDVSIVTPPGHDKSPELYAPYQIIFDPDDPNTYYVSNWWDGVYRVTNNKVTACYDWNNSPLKPDKDWNVCIVPGIQFDKYKNLWVVEGEVANIVTVLPRAAQLKETVSESDWITMDVTNFSPTKKSSFIIAQKSNTKIFTDGVWGSSLVFFDDKGTLENASDDISKSYTSLFDQDEKTFEWNNINCFIEDKNGKVWMGTDNGVVEFDPSKGTSSNFRINRLKVPRNDGTSYADYLLENETVLSMAIDGANRKWIGTQSSGVFLVSADGSQILKKFNTSNSYLPDNCIMSLACNTSNNSVYIGTLNGMAEYSSDATVAAQNYNDVYAYPNPVRPDYLGLITVRGLMDNSLIKFADAAGNVVYSTRSVGGMATWDGCNSNGERVKTGVYYVLASQSDNDNTSGAVTKILIVK